MSTAQIRPPLPVHTFEGAKFGCCQARVKDSDGVMRRCNRQVDNPVHRYYPCREPGCVVDVRWRSIEQRDRHEANAHGDGW